MDSPVALASSRFFHVAEGSEFLFKVGEGGFELPLFAGALVRG
jgi:hypothetical protein